MFSGADWVKRSWLFVGLWCAVVAVIVAITAGSEQLSCKPRKVFLPIAGAEALRALAKRPTDAS